MENKITIIDISDKTTIEFIDIGLKNSNSYKIDDIQNETDLIIKFIYVNDMSIIRLDYFCDFILSKFHICLDKIKQIHIQQYCIEIYDWSILDNFPNLQYISIKHDFYFYNSKFYNYDKNILEYFYNKNIIFDLNYSFNIDYVLNFYENNQDNSYYENNIIKSGILDDVNYPEFNHYLKIFLDDIGVNNIDFKFNFKNKFDSINIINITKIN